MRKLTTEEFIAKARGVHGSKYDYTMVNYVNNKTKIVIICPLHGQFSQAASSHLRGVGCPHCFGNAKLTTETFIVKAKEIHGPNKYDYSLVEYNGSGKKVSIICPLHGQFLQTASSHLSGVGCRQCHYREITSNLDEFISKAQAVHGPNKYDYSLVKYVNSQTKVTIVCHIEGHGPFSQKPNSHLSGNGCFKCQYDSLRSNTDEFISKAQAVHGPNKYDYSLVEYNGSGKKVSIICQEHGQFWQKASSHLSGNGCPTCWKVENILKQKEAPTNLYWLELRHNITGEIFHKVGVTYVHCDDNRFTQIQKDSDSTILKVYMRYFESRFEAEYQEQRILARVRDGWILDKNLKKIRRLPKSKRLSTKFKFDKRWAGSTECFTPRKIAVGFKRMSLNSISGNEVTDNA